MKNIKSLIIIGLLAITGIVTGQLVTTYINPVHPSALDSIQRGVNYTVLMESGNGSIVTWQQLVMASAQFANQGTTTTILHGNGSGNPSWGAVTLTTDVTGVLPLANGGSNANLTAGAGELVYSTASAMALTSSYTAGYLWSAQGTNAPTAISTIGSGITWNGVAIGATYGGTGQNSASSTGVAQVSSGTWSFSTALANGTTATTQTNGDNTTKVATDAFVLANAGTGNVSGTGAQYQVAFWTSSSAIEGITNGSSGLPLVSNGTSAYPSWQYLPITGGGTGGTYISTDTVGSGVNDTAAGNAASLWINGQSKLFEQDSIDYTANTQKNIGYAVLISVRVKNIVDGEQVITWYFKKTAKPSVFTFPANGTNGTTGAASAGICYTVGVVNGIGPEVTVTASSAGTFHFYGGAGSLYKITTNRINTRYVFSIEQKI
jgi:hypothetical protein